MTTHPNRARRPGNTWGPGHRPTPAQIRAAREAAGLSQAKAAGLIYATERSWQGWEAAERGMNPALFELFMARACIMAGESTLADRYVRGPLL